MKRLLLCFAFLVLLAGAAVSHESRPAYLELQQTSEDNYDLLWKVPARGSDMRLGLYVRLPVDCKIVRLPSSAFLGGAFIERSTISRAGGLSGAEIYIEGLSTTLTDVLVRIVRLDGSMQVVLLTPAAPSFVVDSAPSFMGVAKTYLGLGVQHIWKGVDHLLFVACLVLIAGISRKLLWTITGFTLAHSVTLAMAALDVVRLPIPPIEAFIALSVVFLASEIARGPSNALSYRYPIVVSSLFGLLHGFGFAAVLQSIGIPANEVATSLLFFNVGVEIGQVLFVAGVIAILLAGRWIERWSGKRNTISVAALTRAKMPFAYMIGSIATFWMIDRISGF